MSMTVNNISPYSYMNYNANYGNTFSLSNYTNMSTPSIFSGQSGYYSQQFMAPQQQNNNEAFMQQLVLMLLSFALQGRNGGSTSSTTTEETIVTGESDEVKLAKIQADKEKSMNKENNKAAAAAQVGKTVSAIVNPVGAIFKGW